MQKPRRKHLPPDTRPRWNDPDLKVYRFGRVLTDYQAQLSSKRSIDNSWQKEWRNDPSYFWRKAA